MSYNGWENWDTFETYNILNNNVNNYTRAKLFASKCPFLFKTHVEHAIRVTYLGTGYEGPRLSEVNWIELINAFKEESREYA